MTTNDNSVMIYPVGLLRDWQHGKLRRSLFDLARQARRREWRSMRNHFNGYLAEPQVLPDGLHGCGHGWTQARALRSLNRRIAKDCT